MLAKSKLNSIETLISQALIDMEISHEEFITILKEKDKYEKMKDNLRSENEKYMSNDTSFQQCIKLWDWVVHINSKIWVEKINNTYKMESYCLECKKNTENIDPKVSSTSTGRVMTLSKCVICGSKKSRFIKHQEAKGLLSKLGIKTLLSKIPILGDILF